MLEIRKNNGDSLTVAPGTKVAMQYVSPFFKEEIGNAEYSLPVRMLGDGKNKLAMGFFEKIKSSRRSIRDTGVTLLDDGSAVATDMTLYVDTASMLDVNTSKCEFEGQLVGAKDAFLVWAEGKTLRDLSFTAIPTPATVDGTLNAANDWATNVVLNPALAPYVCFPSVYFPNGKWDDGTGSGTPLMAFGMCNWWNSSFNHFQNSLASVPPSAIATTIDIIPMFKLWWVIEKIMADAGYTIGNYNLSIMADADFRKLSVFNNSIMNQSGSFYCQPKNHVPLTDVVAFMQGVCLNFGIQLYFKPGYVVDFVSMNGVLNTTAYEDWTDKVKATFIKTAPPENELGVVLGYDMEASPDLVSREFKSITGFEDAIDAGNYVVENTLAGVPTTYALNQHILIRSLNSFYQVTNIAPFTLTPTLNNLDRISTLNAKVKKVSGVGAVDENENTIMGSGGIYSSPPQNNAWMASSWLIAALNGGNQLPEIIEFPCALLFYHGLQNTLAGSNTLPHGSNHNYLPDTTTKLAAFHLGWNGPEGLYETFWKDWVAMLNSMVVVKYGVNLNMVDIKNLDYTKKIRIDGVYYLLKSLKVEYPMEGYAEVELVVIG